MVWQEQSLTPKQRLVYDLLRHVPGFRPFLDPEGNTVLLFKESGGEALALVGVGWQSEEAILVLQARVEGLGEFSPSLANAWNAAKRWPRAWVREGGVVLDFQVFLPGEVDVELLGSLLLPVLAGVGEFLSWAVERTREMPPVA
ncbi:hypothetical protein QT17_12750 [Thermus sp. 2.9]|uniref:YbjN domain-containing protein n=1 Tax=Thermus sp. (strain 2.9) TaxID=1577051 RepID=UPI0005432CEE|nr:YbjN domain-containing protein [Thermus sp. 2.9]KHG64367.1 hypothetical protein QT17_12750 [Thermus sp. 2.9]